MSTLHHKLRKCFLMTAHFVTICTLHAQTSHSLGWRAEQQPNSIPCSAEDIAFVNAPEQMVLEKSYDLLPDFSYWKCETIKGPVFDGSRVLIIEKPSVIDDGLAYTLIQPKGSTNVRLLPFADGGHLLWRNESDWHNRAAMNAVLQTSPKKNEDIDWLAVSLAYLTIIGAAPSLVDQHYSPGPTDKYFKSYTVSGLLSEIPSLTQKHLLPTLTCKNDYCTVRFYYRTEPVMPLQSAVFEYRLCDGALTLLKAETQDYLDEHKNKKAVH